MFLIQDSMGGGAWPFLVGGLLCQVNSGNERDLFFLIRNLLILVTSSKDFYHKR